MENKHNPFSGELKGKLINKQKEETPMFFESNLSPSFTKDENGTYIFSLKDNQDVVFSKTPLATLTADPVSINERTYGWRCCKIYSQDRGLRSLVIY